MFEAVGKVMLHDRLRFSMDLMLHLTKVLPFTSVRATRVRKSLYLAFNVEAL